jgi:hypothetical protein
MAILPSADQRFSVIPLADAVNSQVQQHANKNGRARGPAV